MALKEHDNNILIKEYNDPVERYLRRIIQRYFQIENDISQESKEAIIIQAYTRLKEYINALDRKYILCLNEKSGAIDLTIRDLNGEESFEKNTAFNKDFCADGIEEADHIVSGDDSRLSNARIPLAHTHEIEDIIGLRELLEEYHLINGGFHLHTNFSILEMLIYTGSMISIDLLLLEDLEGKVNKAVEKFTETNEYFVNTAQKYINQLQNIFTAVYNRLNYIDTNIDSWIKNFVQDSNLYTDNKSFEIKNQIRVFLKHYLSKEEYDLLERKLNQAIKLVHQGEFDFKDIELRNPAIDSICTNTRTGYFNFDYRFDIKEGYTKIALFNKQSIEIEESILNYFHNNDLNNCMYKCYLDYTKDEVHYRDQLPHIYQVNDSVHDFILIYCDTDSDNNFNIHAKRLSYLPVYLDNYFIFNTHITDKSGKESYKSLCIIKDDNDISNPVIAGNPITPFSEQKTDSTSVFITEDIDDGSTITTTTNELFLGAQAILDDPSDTYEKKCKITWSIDDPTRYTYKLYKRVNGGVWQDLMYSQSFSSSDTAVLHKVYADGHVYKAQIELFGEDKKATWKIDEDNCIVTSVNSSTFDMMLTDGNYVAYRHRATLTVKEMGTDVTWDNDVLGIIISAKKIGNRIYTLSILCSGSNEGHVAPMTSGCKLVYNYQQGDEQVIADCGSFLPFNWDPEKKVNFDIRKDKNNLIIYRSDLYTMTNYFDFDDTKTSETPCLTTTFESIENTTGIDFSEGMVGYCDYSQQFGTIVGVNLETFNTYIDTEYIDEFDDQYNPLQPYVQGYLKSSNDTEDIYKFNITMYDYYEYVEYKLELYPDIDWTIDDVEHIEEKQEPIVVTSPIKITTFSDINELYYNINSSKEKFENDSVTSVIEEKYIIGSKGHQKEITIKVLKDQKPNDRLWFCYNDYKYAGLYNDIKQNMNLFNADLLNINDDNKDYCKSITLLHNTTKDYLTYHIDNNSDEYFNGNDIFTLDNDTITYFFGEFKYGKIGDFFPDAKVIYQLFQVPGKGEDDA